MAAGSLAGGLAWSRFGVEAPMGMAVVLCALALPATWSTRRLPQLEDPVLDQRA
jgi:predicted MFS family arabinose efflux permease